MDGRGLLTYGFSRITELYDDVAGGLDAEQLHHRPDGIGYGHTSEQVDAVGITDLPLLGDYHREVTLATARYLATVDESELERVVDPHWDPPVTAGVRLVSIQSDSLQHLGQAAYGKGLLQRQAVPLGH